MARMPILFLAALILSSIGATGVHAGHDDFAYKWPFESTATGTITTLPFKEEHACGSGS